MAKAGVSGGHTTSRQLGAAQFLGRAAILAGASATVWFTAAAAHAADSHPSLYQSPSADAAASPGPTFSSPAVRIVNNEPAPSIWQDLGAPLAAAAAGAATLAGAGFSARGAYRQQGLVERSRDRRIEQDRVIS